MLGEEHHAYLIPIHMTVSIAECLRQELKEAQLKEVAKVQLQHEHNMEGLRLKLGKELAQREAEVRGVVYCVHNCGPLGTCCVEKRLSDVMGCASMVSQCPVHPAP